MLASQCKSYVDTAKSLMPSGVLTGREFSFLIKNAFPSIGSEFFLLGTSVVCLCIVLSR